MKTLLHVNYHEGAGRLDNLFKIASKYGYDGVELRWRYRFADYDQASYQAKVAQLRRKSLRVRSDRPLWVHCDGETGEPSADVLFRISRNRLNLLI